MKRYASPLHWLLFALCLAGMVFFIIKRADAYKTRMLTSGTEHLLFTWSDSIQTYEKELGVPIDDHMHPYPDTTFRDLQLTDVLNKGNFNNKVYQEPIASSRLGMQPVDGWQNPLVFDFQKKGRISDILSPGPDGKVGTADDMTSLTARKRSIPLPKE